MKIPKSIHIIDSEFHITLDKELQTTESIVGKASFWREQIILQTNHKHYTKNQMYQTFWHEAVHCILNKMGEDKLNDDEKFVDLMASCLNQIQRDIENG